MRLCKCDQETCDFCYDKVYHDLKLELCEHKTLSECTCCPPSCEFCELYRIEKENLSRLREWEEIEKMNNEAKKRYQKIKAIELPFPAASGVLRHGMENTKPTYKKFMDYYNSSKEFRERHKQYMSMKVHCPLCNFLTSRSNLSKHRKSRNCKNRQNQFQRDQKMKLKEKEELLDSFNKIIQKIQKL